MNMTVFPNRLCTAEERTINFDPFGNWAAEQWVHKRDLASYETFKKTLPSDQKLATKFKKIYDLFLKKYLMRFDSPIANEYAASTLGGSLRFFLEHHKDIHSALDSLLAIMNSK